MVSVLRTLQAEWNELVPLARSRGIPRVRLLNAPLESIAYRREKLEWLRRQLGQTSTMTSPQEIRTTSAVQADMPQDLTFGLEIEAFLPPGVSRDELASQLTLAGIACASELYNHTLRTSWKVLTDGSLGDYARGFELVSPILRGSAAVEDIRVVCQVLSRLRVKVSRRCGFHVHVGVRGQGVQFFRNLANLYHSAQETIDTFMSPSRRGTANTYARPLRVSPGTLAASTVDDVVRSVGQTPGLSSSRQTARYSKLNFMSYYQHGTVEFRHHQGTVEFDKIINWTKFCLRMVEAARKGTQLSRTDLPSILEALEAKQDEKEYFVRRANFFARHDNRPTIPLESIRVPVERPLDESLVSADFAEVELRAVALMAEDTETLSTEELIARGRDRFPRAAQVAAATSGTTPTGRAVRTPVVSRNGNAFAQMQTRAAARRAQEEAARQDRERRLNEMNPFERHGEEAEEAAHSRFIPPRWR